MGFVRTQGTDIAAPAGEVYAYLLDLTRHPEWANNPMTMTHVIGPATGVGATYESRVEHAVPGPNVKAKATIVVVEADAPKRIAYECDDDGGRYRWTIDLTDANGGTRVTQTVTRLDAPIWVKAVQPLLWKAFGSKQIANGLVNMKARLEA